MFLNYISTPPRHRLFHSYITHAPRLENHAHSLPGVYTPGYSQLDAPEIAVIHRDFSFKVPDWTYSAFRIFPNFRTFQLFNSNFPIFQYSNFNIPIFQFLHRACRSVPIFQPYHFSTIPLQFFNSFTEHVEVFQSSNFRPKTEIPIKHKFIQKCSAHPMLSMIPAQLQGTRGKAPTQINPT